MLLLETSYRWKRSYEAPSSNACLPAPRTTLKETSVQGSSVMRVSGKGSGNECLDSPPFSAVLNGNVAGYREQVGPTVLRVKTRVGMYFKLCSKCPTSKCLKDYMWKQCKFTLSWTCGLLRFWRENYPNQCQMNHLWNWIWNGGTAPCLKHSICVHALLLFLLSRS